MRYSFVPVILGVFLLFGPATVGAAANPDDIARVEAAASVLQEMTRIPEQGIPADLLNDAQGIAIFPGLLKAGFIGGARFGQGVVVAKGADGSWTPPAFITLAGGSFGLQIGIKSTDLVLVFRTSRGLEAIEGGKLTLGGNISVAAGPVGRTGEAGTDIQLRSEILSYSRSRGAFAGVSVEGSVLSFNQEANRDFYGVPNPLRMQAASVPDSARHFSCVLARSTGSPSKICT